MSNYGLSFVICWKLAGIQIRFWTTKPVLIYNFQKRCETAIKFIVKWQEYGFFLDKNWLFTTTGHLRKRLSQKTPMSDNAYLRKCLSQITPISKNAYYLNSSIKFQIYHIYSYNKPTQTLSLEIYIFEIGVFWV